MTDAVSDALVLKGLSKAYDKPAVDKLDLTVKAGELYALQLPVRKQSTQAHRGREGAGAASRDRRSRTACRYRAT